MIITELTDTSRPRLSAEASSPMAMGTTQEVNPTPSPTEILAMRKKEKSLASAQAAQASSEMQEPVMIIFFRP